MYYAVFFDLGEDQYTLGIYKDFEIPESPEGMKIYELISNRIPFVLGLRCKIYNSSKNLDMRITFTDLAITGYTGDGFKITAKTPTAFLYGFGNTADSDPITMALVVYPKGNIELHIELGNPNPA